MQISFLKKFIKWYNLRKSYSGLDKKSVARLKGMRMGGFYGLMHCALLTIGFLLFAPGLTLLIQYGILLCILFPVTLSLNFSFPRYLPIIHFIHFLIFNFLTFYYILRLGGIPSSGGLVFVGISSVLGSIPLRNVAISVAEFTIVSLLLITATIMHPYLRTPGQMTPELNSIVFMINTLSLTFYALLAVLVTNAQQKKLNQLETESIKKLNDLRNRLFTNITHEFRTPLTVIQGMAGLIEKNPVEWLTDGIQKIKSNSMILVNLVNQMLDHSKIETGAMQIKYIQGNIVERIGYITGLFMSVAKTKGIQLQYNPSYHDLMMDFDPDKLHQIITNLVSNALKFTPEGGFVTITLEIIENNQTFVIKVSDTGIGIDKQNLEFIFDRFYQVDNRLNHSGGTGLGLSLTKELTELLGGKITVESIAGKGSCFSVHLPVTNNAPFIASDSEDEINNVSGLETSHCRIENTPKEKTDFSTLPLLLIVEDSTDVSQYLAAILKSEYQIIRAENGREGLEKTLETVPDIILSDVMMPVMDGIEFLDSVKKDFRTSHIPVVMLTAKADIDSRIEGLERGADAYLSKPFNEKELHVILHNLIEIRKILHNRYASPDKLPETPEVEFKLEDEFMLKVKQLLEANYEDDEFGIQQICSELALSRTQLYRKFKSVSNKTIAEYFKIIKLNKARDLLLNSKLNITQVAFSTGFKNLSHFSREFSAWFGKSPNEFRKK